MKDVEKPILLSIGGINFDHWDKFTFDIATGMITKELSNRPEARMFIDLKYHDAEVAELKAKIEELEKKPGGRPETSFDVEDKYNEAAKKRVW